MIENRVVQGNRRRLAAIILWPALAVLLAPVAETAELEPEQLESFVSRMQQHGVASERVRTLLAKARYRQSIIDAITAPAEAKPWHEYRQIFVNDRRIAAGVAFWRDNRELVAEVAAAYGVQPGIIVAIVGVETGYGANTGGYRVLDALVTLGFSYPRRGEFFRSELSHLLRLGEEEDLAVTEASGSYAGAMGIGQFMPSSYREYAVDFDGDDRRDLWHSLPDALASVSNYLHRHGWRAGEAIAVEAFVDEATSVPEPRGGKPGRSIAELESAGIEPRSRELSRSRKATIIELETKDGPQYWLGLHNFYVLTRYNRSHLYAMAVLQLSRALEAGLEAS